MDEAMKLAASQIPENTQAAITAAVNRFLFFLQIARDVAQGPFSPDLINYSPEL
jgi:hypothetical protein